MTKDEALNLALEALHGFIPYLPLNDEAQCGRYDKAITAIKEALAQPEHDYKDLYEKEKRRSAMWLSKYEEVAGPAPKAIPMAQPEQEPVQWGVDWGRAGDQSCVSIIKRTPNGGIEVVAVEYGPQRTWVGLTDEEIDDLSRTMVKGNKSVNWLCQAIKAKLKEKST